MIKPRLCHGRFFNRFSAENALSAVAEVTGIVRAMSQSQLLPTSDITSYNVLKLVDCFSHCKL